MITRRGLLAGILGAGIAPAIITNPMKLWVPPKRTIKLMRSDYGRTMGIEPPEMQRLRNARMRAMLDNVALAASPPLVMPAGIALATREMLRMAQPLKLAEFGKRRKWP